MHFAAIQEIFEVTKLSKVLLPSFPLLQFTKYTLVREGEENR